MSILRQGSTDHKNINLAELHSQVIRGESNGKILWQPRIGCWYDDRVFAGQSFPEPFSGMTLPEIYKELGCSARIYDYNEQYDGCFKRVDHPKVRRYSRKRSPIETEYVIETPVGNLTSIETATSSSPSTIHKRWWITCQEDMKIATWIEEHSEWRWDENHYRKTYDMWGDLGLPTIFMPRVNIQNLYLDTMGVEEAIYAIYDYPQVVEKYFKAMDESHERLIHVINQSTIEVINFGDNLHGGTLPPHLFQKYVLPAYQQRNELLHKAGKFTHSHWDGDVKPLLPFAKDCDLDGIEAITPKPQGDVTLEEVKAALGDDIFLLDGIAAILFDEMFSLEQLKEQTKKVIELFAPKLILGISDEISSTGNLERIRYVGQLVDDYNAGKAK